jgi:5-(carboxyamino)imidazole ribonucleotide synthase
MAGEAASALGLSMVVLAKHPDDAACDVAAEVVIGSPLVESDLRALAARCEVMTFDHEQVDLSLLRALVAEGVVVRPGVATLEVAVDKAHMRRAFATDHGWPVVLKAVRGGYDGKGVWPVNELAAAAEVVDHLRGSVLVEEMVPLRAELAIMVARRPSGEAAAWPAVETAQVGGVCREVLVPGRLPPELMAEAVTLGQRVAGIVEAVGVLAVELFWSTDGRLLVNEIAARPHNSGHWTIEGAVTSQFENHLRAVLDLPLGTTALQHARVASVNIFGGPSGEDPVALLPGGLAVPGGHVHLYGKEGRPGRKLGHVTVCGDDAIDVRSRAWAAALAMGTPRPDGLDLPTGSA